MKTAKKWIFISVLLVTFLAADFLAARVMQPFFLRCGRFNLSDFEIVQRDHPEKTWDKVFFGNSVVISGFREEESSSGYINLGVDYGVVTDLWDMLRKGHVHVGSDIVIGLSALALYDDFDTNPYYPWHRTWYQPYCYFARDRLKQLLEETFGQVTGLSGAPLSYDYLGQQRPVYYGAMSEEEVLSHRASADYRPYLTLDETDYRENLQALEHIYHYCETHDIRLRLVWLPANPIVARDDATACAYELSKQFAGQHGVAFYDMTDMLDTECFYDGGHLNYEYGSHVFTEVIDPWLNE